jgi:predicted HAD superfamily Cof-like phosphohydrolase
MIPTPRTFHGERILDAFEFRGLMDQPIYTAHPQVLQLQESLIAEEFIEFLRAPNDENRLKELADLAYVCYQYAAARGWDLDAALHRVHHSNLSKLVDGKPIRDEAGKVLKGPDYQPPVLFDLIS